MAKTAKPKSLKYTLWTWQLSQVDAVLFNELMNIQEPRTKRERAVLINRIKKEIARVERKNRVLLESFRREIKAKPLEKNQPLRKS
jgi:hypothetical protein